MNKSKTKLKVSTYSNSGISYLRIELPQIHIYKISFKEDGIELGILQKWLLETMSDINDKL